MNYKDKNRPYSQVLMERDGVGNLSSIYTYGNQRINSESYNNLTGLYTYDGRGSVSTVIGTWGDFRASYWYDGLGNVKSQIHGYGVFGNGKKYFGYNAEQYNSVTGNQNLRARQVNIRRQRFLTEDTYLGNKNNPLTLNRYIYGNDNPLVNKDPDGLAPIYIQNQNTNNNGREPYILKQGEDQYFIRNGAEPVYSKNGDNYYITSGNIEIKEIPQPMVGGITAIAPLGYQDNSPYAIDNIYHINNYITNTNPKTKFLHKKEPIVNVTIMLGVGIGGKVQVLEDTGLQFRFASEIDLFREVRGVLNLEEKFYGTGYSFNRNYLNNTIDNKGSVLYFTNNNDDIIYSYGIEAYLGIGGGVSVNVNISEIMRRAQSMFKGGCDGK